MKRSSRLAGKLRSPIVVLLVLLCCLVSAKGNQPAEGAKARNAWLYTISGKNGSFHKVTGKQWLETNPEGVEVGFEEVNRTDVYVELFDRGRKLWLRLYPDYAEWRQGEKGGWNRGEKGGWNRLYAGRWVDATTLPKVTKKTAKETEEDLRKA